MFGGTIITDSAGADFVGVITNVVTGDTDGTFAIWSLFRSRFWFYHLVFVAAVQSLVFPQRGRAAASSHYIFVLSMVFISGYLSEASAPVVSLSEPSGGFSGLNRLAPHTGFLTIVLFLLAIVIYSLLPISAGMLVYPMLLFAGTDALTLCRHTASIGILPNTWRLILPAFIYRFSLPERNIMFTSVFRCHAAATLLLSR